MTAPSPGWTIGVDVSGGTGYPVRVGPGVLGELRGLLEELSPASRYALISDERVYELHGEAVRSRLPAARGGPTVHTFPPGEAQKSREEWSRITDLLLKDGIGRDGCILALGGGVTGDLAGFVAATYMRGIPIVQIPTSLVAMVDSSVGGKTGVDVPLGKNLVGAFHPPRFVLADTELTATLPRGQRSQGLAEAVKHGAILDADYFQETMNQAGALLDGEPAATAEMVARSVELKAGVVSRDEKEGGLRQVLNFGHTLGHALEQASNYRLPHGSAVAMGMVLEARLGQRLGVTRAGVAERLQQALRAVELPTEPPVDMDADELLDLVSRDKKVRGGMARYVLLRELGEVDPGDGWSRPVDPVDVRALLRDDRR